MVTQKTATLRYAKPEPPFWRLRFDVESPPEPGGFVLADLGAPLRTPLFPSLVDASGFVTHVPPGHPAIELLPGVAVDVLGPLGRGFRIRKRVTRLLLVADARRLPVLNPLFTEAPSVVVIVEAGTRARLPAPSRFPASVELVLVTRDGSGGYPGPLLVEGGASSGTDLSGVPRLAELIRWADGICAALDPARYSAMRQLVQAVRLQPQPNFAQAWIRVPMPCGVGACEVCRVRTRQGERRACVDGPVFDLMMLR